MRDKAGPPLRAFISANLTCTLLPIMLPFQELQGDKPVQLNPVCEGVECGCDCCPIYSLFIVIPLFQQTLLASECGQERERRRRRGNSIVLNLMNAFCGSVPRDRLITFPRAISGPTVNLQNWHTAYAPLYSPVCRKQSGHSCHRLKGSLFWNPFRYLHFMAPTSNFQRPT